MTRLEEYFKEIESHFIRLRQKPLLLSPRDVQEIERWHEDGIPLEIVVRGMEIYFERIQDKPSKLRRFASVLYCRNDILDLWERYLDRLVGASEEPKAGEEDPQEALEALEGILRDAAKEADPALADAVHSSRRSIARLRRKADQESTELIERSLDRIEKRLIKRILMSLEREQEQAIEEKVRTELSSYKDRLDAKVFEGLVRRGVQRQVLAMFSLPRLTLFS